MSKSEDVPDQIEKSIILRAPLSRVWRAVSQAKEFGYWFGVQFEGPFEAGKSIQGKIVPTQVDPEVGKLQEPHRGTPYEWTVERMEPERLITFRWHPYAVDRQLDYSKEPMTLITFQLEAVDEGTRLTITESGFSQIPLERRLEAFRANEGGWEHQTKLIEKYLTHHGA